jgi:hypothetical protein
MARATERRVPVPRKVPRCPVQEQGRKGYCNEPVVKGQHSASGTCALGTV